MSRLVSKVDPADGLKRLCAKQGGDGLWRLVTDADGAPCACGPGLSDCLFVRYRQCTFRCPGPPVEAYYQIAPGQTPPQSLLVGTITRGICYERQDPAQLFGLCVDGQLPNGATDCLPESFFVLDPSRFSQLVATSCCFGNQGCSCVSPCFTVDGCNDLGANCWDFGSEPCRIQTGSQAAAVINCAANECYCMPAGAVYSWSGSCTIRTDYILKQPSTSSTQPILRVETRTETGTLTTDFVDGRYENVASSRIYRRVVTTTYADGRVDTLTQEDTDPWLPPQLEAVFPLSVCQASAASGAATIFDELFFDNSQKCNRSENRTDNNGDVTTVSFSASNIGTAASNSGSYSFTEADFAPGSNDKIVRTASGSANGVAVGELCQTQQPTGFTYNPPCLGGAAGASLTSDIMAAYSLAGPDRMAALRDVHARVFQSLLAGEASVPALPASSPAINPEDIL